VEKTRKWTQKVANGVCCQNGMAMRSPRGGGEKRAKRNSESKRKGIWNRNGRLNETLQEKRWGDDTMRRNDHFPSEKKNSKKKQRGGGRDIEYGRNL